MIVHLAGLAIQLDVRLRQRCSWCGAVLVDYALDRIAVPLGTDPTPPTWPVGAFVLVDGPMSTIVQHEDGQPIPAGSCGRLDPEVTA